MGDMYWTKCPERIIFLLLMEQQHGLLVVDKPKGLSSAQCVNRLKRLGQKKIGHAGTLDPMATGVLLVLLGHATKISGHLMTGGEKMYRGTLRLGHATDTWDAEGEITAEMPWEHITENAIAELISDWMGRSEQLVPPYSAAKHDGQPLYRLVRSGKSVPVKTKMIEISRAEILKMELPFVTFRVVCSSGTYIRSLAHSLGMRLGCGAVLTELTREYSHPFGLDRATPLDALLAEPALLPERIVPVTAGLPDWPVLTLNIQETMAVRNGRPLVRETAIQDGVCDRAILLDPQGSPLALAEVANSQSGPVWTVLRGLWTTEGPFLPTKPYGG